MTPTEIKESLQGRADDPIVAAIQACLTDRIAEALEEIYASTGDDLHKAAGYHAAAHDIAREIDELTQPSSR